VEVRSEVVRNPEGKPAVMHMIQMRRLVHGTTLHGTQVSEHKRHVWDQLQLMTFANPWDNLVVAGAQTAYDLRQEPLTYYHRTGPVGAMFRELARRGRSYDHVAMVGLGTGSVSCYARPGQKLTFYEIDPLVKKLVADTDKYFSYVRDAENRGGIGADGKFHKGAQLDFRMGDARLKLKDTDDKYSLLLVDAFSSDSIPVHLLTVEAVQLYLERITDDGIIALHISNKYVSLEPVVAAIADKLGLAAYVWNDTHRDDDDTMERVGKTSSSWVALARKKEHLGDRIASVPGDLVGEWGGGKQLQSVIAYEYPEVKALLDRGPAVPGKENKDAVLGYLVARKDDPRAQRYAEWIVKYKSEFTPIGTILAQETGYGFHPVEKLKNLDAWTDDYADVMRVMMIPELQSLRRFFGLPTLNDN
jgi:hypothetical protein